MTRLSKNQAKIAFSFCTLFSLYFPVAFSQQVDTAWVRRYNGPGNGDDKAVALAVDDSGNVYVTGSSFDSTTGYDYCTIKYLPNGDTAWVRKYNGSANDTDLARDMVLDASGNIYITGVSQGGITTIKYDSSGNELWVRRLLTSFNFSWSVLGGYALELDGRGNLYVTGQQWDLESFGWFFIKYDTSGNQIWVRFDYGGGIRSGFDLALDTSGNAFIAAPNQTVKYDPQGNWLWTQNYPGTLHAIAVSSSGNVYVTGSSSGDYATIKYDSGGNQMWVRRFHNLFTVPEDGAFALAVDSKENVYVTGMQAGDEIVPYWATLKYDSAGNQIWWEGFAGGTKGLAIVVGADENAFVAGYGGNPPFQRFVTARYGANGNQLWVKSLTGFGQANAITLDTKGNVYVTGFNVGNGTGNDYATVKYSPLPQVKGDLNLDGVLDPFDVVLSLNCTFLGEPPPAAPTACDINCDGRVSPADVVILLNMVFLSAAAPC